MVLFSECRLVGMSHMPNVCKAHAVPYQVNCPPAPRQWQAHPCCSRALRSNSERFVCRSCLCASSITNGWLNKKLRVASTISST
jgi:hypothetical protein